MGGLAASDNHARKQKIPISLGKPSLRLRLEAYYRLIAPDQIADTKAWRSRFEQIWDKFGGTESGEYKLSLRLRKKYGDAVKLEIVKTASQAASAKKALFGPSQDASASKPTRSEEWFELRDTEKGSGIIKFSSVRFDPVALLRSDHRKVSECNPVTAKSPMMDRVDLCKSLLPESDPLFRPSRKHVKKASVKEAKVKESGAFASIAKPHAKGPLSILYNAFLQKQRIRVVTRYMNCIRGTLSGRLIAFDKHSNLILRDAVEIYSPRNPNADGLYSNLEMEVSRRHSANHIAKSTSESTGNTSSVEGSKNGVAPDEGSWVCRERRLPQIMVRGDMVVSVHLAKNEQSMWPQTSLSPSQCLYQPRNVLEKTRALPPRERMGTPGSLGLLLLSKGERNSRYNYASSSSSRPN